MKTKQYYLYLITNEANGMHYVGQTSNPRCRFYKSHYKHNHELMADIEKFGQEAFKIDIIARCSDQLIAEQLEKKFIDKFDCLHHGYNKAYTGKLHVGLHRTEESNAKRSKAIRKLVWVFNPFDLETKRVTPKTAAQMLNEGWMLGRFSSRTSSKNKKLFTPTIPEGTADFINA